MSNILGLDGIIAPCATRSYLSVDANNLFGVNHKSAQLVFWDLDALAIDKLPYLGKTDTPHEVESLNTAECSLVD